MKPYIRGRPRRKVPVAAGSLVLGALAACSGLIPSAESDQDWPVYGADLANSRYSGLTQINRSNVDRLEVAWIYRTGDHREGGRSQIQCHPIVVEAVLYCTSPALKAFALHADTGEEIWSFDPFRDQEVARHVNRGVAYWEKGPERRVFYTVGPRLYALDAASGRPVAAFGEDGSIDLRDGLGRDLSDQTVIATTPGVVYRDLLIQGTTVSEGEGGAPGHVRAYDVRTGEVRWIFHTIPQPGDFGHDTWPEDAWLTSGGANSWAGMSVDEARGIVFVPTGSPAFDWHGGDRHGKNLFGNTLLALDAGSGERIWHFQTVHHDIWDRDLPAPPNLLTVEHDGRRIPAVAQITKQGYVFLFDLETGEPLFPVEERPVPRSDLKGEQAWPTQPFPVRPAPFARQELTEAELTDISPEARAQVLERFRRVRSAGRFVPPSVEGSIIFPGLDGGGEWGGAAVDPSGILYVNASEMPWIAAMLEKPDPARPGLRAGEDVYAADCAGCHGAEREGGGRAPNLLGMRARLSAGEIRRIVEQGRGLMPSFGHLPAAERELVVAYLLGRRMPRLVPGDAAATDPHRHLSAQGLPYQIGGAHRFTDPEGYPAVKPPWGTLTAIDMNRGEIVWQVPLGEFSELTARGIPPTGTENYGGPIVTAGGLIFIAATQDEKFRAFHSGTGEVLWETSLPAGGYATPSTYAVDGKQYVVIAAGGGKMGTGSADAYIAFALPD